MLRTMDHLGNVRFELADSDAARAEQAIGRLGAATHPHAKKTAADLKRALAADQRTLSWELLVSLSRWCHTDPSGTYRSGKPAAEGISRALFEGEILPRLEKDEARMRIDARTARATMREFLKGLKREQSERHDASEESGAQSRELLSGGPVRRSGRGSAGAASHGSQFCLQRWMDEAPDELADRIVLSSLLLTLTGVSDVIWKSPLPAESFYEYRDDFLIPLRLEQHEDAVRRFWPSNGPQWDGVALLGLGQRQGALLVEAKAYPEECYSRCAASDPTSIALIEAALARVQQFGGVEPGDWKEGAYQLANRLAFLYFMNEELGVPTWLAQLYFINDTSHRPTSLAQWRSAAGEPYRLLGIRPDCRLLERVIPVFVPARG